MLVSRVCSFQFSFCCLVTLQEARFRKISAGVTIRTQTLLKAADSQARRVSSSMTIKIASRGFYLGLFSNLVWVRCTNPGFPAEAQVRRLWCLQMTPWPVVRAGGGGGGMQRRKEDRESVVAVLADDCISNILWLNNIHTDMKKLLWHIFSFSLSQLYSSYNIIYNYT